MFFDDLFVSEERKGWTRFIREEVAADRIPNETGIARFRGIARGQISGDDSGNFSLSPLDGDMGNRVDLHRRGRAIFADVGWCRTYSPHNSQCQGSPSSALFAASYDRRSIAE